MSGSAGVSRNDARGEVYFIRPGDRPYVKIGWALDVPRRLCQLQCGSPEALAVLATAVGSMRDEQAWHRAFAHRSYRAEWFSLEDDLLAAIADCQAFTTALRAKAAPRDPTAAEQYLAWRHEERDSLRARGSGKSNAILTESQVRAIRKDKRSVRAIAAEYGVGKTTIQNVKMGQTWQHVGRKKAPVVKPRSWVEAFGL